MKNLTELIERREQINKEITNLKDTIRTLTEMLHEDLAENDFGNMIWKATKNARMQALLMIMLEKNITQKEAQAIIEAQKEQAA